MEYLILIYADEARYAAMPDEHMPAGWPTLQHTQALERAACCAGAPSWRPGQRHQRAGAQWQTRHHGWAVRGTKEQLGGYFC